MVSPRTRRNAAIVVLVICIVGWPATALTVFSSEPQGILGLSWLSVILQAITILATTDVRDQQDSQ